MMAEEPIAFGFQADSVHSGSISFGRFDNEPLLWERRSSFSHNRIQEEVARCSKHRIVTEKKAYFEAQFKKKALLRQCSLDAQTGIQFGATEKEVQDMRSHTEDHGIVQEQKSDASSDTSIYIGYREDYDNVQEAQVSVHFDESSEDSNDFEEQRMEYQIEGREVPIFEPLKLLPSSDSAVVNDKVDDGTVKNLDTQTVIDCTYSRCDSAEHVVEMKKNIDAYSCSVEEDCKAIDLSAGSRKVEKEPDAVSQHGDVRPQIMVATEYSGTKSNIKVTCPHKDKLRETAKTSSRDLARMGKQSALKAKTFTQSKIIPSTANKLARSTNAEHLLAKSANSISKTLSGQKSAYKETMVIKATKSSVTSMMKDAPTTHWSPNRTEKLIAPKNSGLKSYPATLQFRSDVRAEKKKEDNTVDEIKQFRSGLRTKARTMPSINKSNERLESKSKDIIASRPQMSSSQSRTKVVARTSTDLKADNGPRSSQSQVSTVTSYPGKKPTKTSVVSSLANKSTHLSSMRNAVSAKRVEGNNLATKLKKQTVAPKVEAIKGRITIGVSQSKSERTRICTVRKGTEKPRVQEISRAVAKVC